jgi:hypothetical protein
MIGAKHPKKVGRGYERDEYDGFPRLVFVKTTTVFR